MDPRLVQQVDEIYEQALALPVDQRQQFLDRTCRDQVELRRIVDQLLQSAQQILDMPDQGERTTAANTAFDLQSFHQDLARLVHQQDWSGETLGPYHLDQLAGQGGMGQVYRAHRSDGYFEQQVAIKILPTMSEWLAADAQIRFRREIRLLGQLKHPHIAQIHDAGVNTRGTVYFVMEWVDGQTITQWCASQKLKLKQRLELWLQVVDAVQSAHRRLIIHRDLKPANILVDAKAGVKVLDFGIAQSISEEVEASVRREDTVSSQDQAEISYTHWFSRQYASPEQLKQLNISTASDQYQLGLLLYELMSGEAWRSSADVANGMIAQGPDSTEILQRIRAAAAATNEMRAADLNKLPSDLPCVLKQMLSEDPGHRYPSLGAVIDDIRACIEHRPIAVKRGQKLYTFKQFLRRHWLPTALVSGAVFTVVGFTAHSLHQAGQIVSEQQRTLAELHRNEKMLQFIYRLFDDTDPYAQGEQNLLARDVVQLGLQRARTQFKDDPLTQAQLLGRMSMSLSHMGEDDVALPELLNAAALLKELPNAPVLEQGIISDYIGRTYLYNDDLAAAELWLKRAVAQLQDLIVQEPIVDNAVDQLAIVLNDLGRVYDLQGNRDLQGESFRQAQSLDQRYPGAVTPTTRALTLHNLAVLESDNHKRLEMEKEVLAMRLETYGDGSATVLHTRMIIATLEGLIGNVEAAVDQFEQALPQQKELLGADHRDRAIQLTHYSRQLLRLGRFDDAVAAAREALRVNLLHRTEDSLYTVINRVVLAQALLMQGEFQAAREETLAVLSYTSDEANGAYRYCLSAHGLMASTALLQGNDTEAQEHLSHCELGFFSEQQRGWPYLHEYYVLASLIAMRAGNMQQADEYATKLSAVTENMGVKLTGADVYKDWQWYEWKLIAALATHYHQQPGMSSGAAEGQQDNEPVGNDVHLRQAYEKLVLSLGDQHWKVRLYEPLVAQALIQHVNPFGKGQHSVTEEAAAPSHS